MQTRFNKSLKLLIPLAAVVLSVSSCSTMFGSNTRQVTVNSQPAGASVYLNNANVGTTPATIVLPNYIYDGQLITVKKSGYQTQSIMVSSKFQMVGLFNILNCGFGFLIDAATGDFMKIDPASLNISTRLNATASTKHTATKHLSEKSAIQSK